MQKFETLQGIAAPLPIMNVDTDMIIPKQFLKTIKRTGLGIHLFHEMRYDQETGELLTTFILNKAPYNKAKILISGDNFGCGSSREHAPWALLDFGIRCIIAPSFADIFYNNCFKNGILPIILPKVDVDELMKQAETRGNQAQEGEHFTIDLPSNTVTDINGKQYTFETDDFRKHCLLNGLDDIGLTMQKVEYIDDYEAKAQQQYPWLWGNKVAV